MHVPTAIVEKWLDYGIQSLIGCMEVDKTLLFVAVASLCGVDWDALGSHDWLPNEYKTENLSHVGGQASMVFKMADSTKEKIADTETVRPEYCGEFSVHDMLFDCANAAWLQYLDKKMDYFGVLSLEAQNALLERHCSPAPSFLNEGQASLAAAAGADEPEDEDDDWDSEGAVDLPDLEREGAKRPLHDFQHSCCTKIHKVGRTVGEVLELVTEIVYQEALADTDTCTELISVKNALVTAHAEVKKARDELALLQQKHNTLEGDLRKGEDKVQDNSMEKIKAWFGNVVAAENNIGKIRLK